MTTPTGAELRALAEKAVLLKKARDAGGWQDASAPEAVSLDAVQAVSALEAKMRDLSLVEDILALLDGKAAAERERDALALCPECGAAEPAPYFQGDRIDHYCENRWHDWTALRTSLTRAEERVRTLSSDAREIDHLCEVVKYAAVAEHRRAASSGCFPGCPYAVMEIDAASILRARAALPAQPKEGDAATRSADTDGDEAQGLHLASLDGAPGDDGADLTEPDVRS